MNKQTIVAVGCLVSFLAASRIFSADLPAIPAESIAKKKELLFSDDFSSPMPNKLWHRAVPTFTFESGQLKGSQTRDQDIPAMDGKPAVQKHPAVHGLSVPTKDSVIETKMRFDGCEWLDVEFDDRNETGTSISHYGHLCRAQVHLDRVDILDERDGSQNEKLNAMRRDPDPAVKEQANKIRAAHQVRFPLAEKLELGKWYRVVVETVGEAMRVTIEGKPVAYFKSAGIGHPTKSQIEIGVGGKDGYFKDFKVWNAEAAG